MIRRPQKRFGGALGNEINLAWDGVEAASINDSPTVAANRTSRGTVLKVKARQSIAISTPDTTGLHEITSPYFKGAISSMEPATKTMRVNADYPNGYSGELVDMAQDCVKPTPLGIPFFSDGLRDLFTWALMPDYEVGQTITARHPFQGIAGGHDAARFKGWVFPRYFIAQTWSGNGRYLQTQMNQNWLVGAVEILNKRPRPNGVNSVGSRTVAFNAVMSMPVPFPARWHATFDYSGFCLCEIADVPAHIAAGGIYLQGGNVFDSPPTLDPNSPRFPSVVDYFVSPNGVFSSTHFQQLANWQAIVNADADRDFSSTATYIY